MSTPDSIQVLHLSDLHFGNKNRFQDRDLNKFGTQFANAVLFELEQLAWTKRIDLVIVSGDIAEMGKPAEFAQGATFLKALVENLEVSTLRTLFVPGNHDLSWNRCKIVEAERDDHDWSEAKYRKEVDKAKFEFYQKFLLDFYGYEASLLDSYLGRKPIHAGKLSYLYDVTIGTYPVSVAALNSSEREDHKIHGGYLSQDQCEALIQQWTSDVYQDCLKIAVVHHNPIATTPVNLQWSRDYFEQRIRANNLNVSAEWLHHYTADMVGLDGARELRTALRQSNAHVLLHGHHHDTDEPGFWRRDAGGMLPVLSVGSFGLNEDQLPTNAPLSCQLLRFQLGAEPKLIAEPLEYDPNLDQKGTVERGQFRRNDRSRSRYSEPLDTPKSWRTRDVETSEEAKTEEERETARRQERVLQFAQIYRQRLSGLYSSYDLKNLGVLPGDVTRAQSPMLDDLYMPLRFDETFDIDKTNLGILLIPKELLSLLYSKVANFHLMVSKRITKGQETPEFQRRSLAITGGPGSGKTTWLRYTFRRMREHLRTLPIPIELRMLATYWYAPTTQKKEQHLEAYLEQWIQSQVPDFASAQVKLLDILSTQSPWQPVLLVDGWDELGDLGETIREQLLGMLERYPSLLVIATSRPYGSGRPSRSDGFLPFQVQPLNPTEIEEFAARFYERCYGEDASVAKNQAEQFHTALTRSADASLMAKTPLLLTMMLFINRSKQLPDKRHQLYEEVLTSLLAARPAQQVEEGAKDQYWQWCPKLDAKSQMQIVSRLAHSVQTEHAYALVNSATPIVLSTKQILAYLPSEWEKRQKEGYLAWLCERAGVLIRNAQGYVNFAHLSFQEFLTAYYLNNNMVTEKAANKLLELIGEPQWWETLLLWMALLWDDSHERAEGLIDTLLKAEQHVFVGMMLADGLGSKAIMERWLEVTVIVFQDSWPAEMERFYRAWKTSQQIERRDKIAARLAEAASISTWDSYLRFKQVCTTLGYSSPLLNYSNCIYQTPSAHMNQNNLLQQLLSPLDFATANILFSLTLSFPQNSEAYLLTWPSRRSEVARHLQCVVSFYKTQENLIHAVKHIHTQPMHYKNQLMMLFNSTAHCLKSISYFDDNRHVGRDLSEYLTKSISHIDNLRGILPLVNKLKDHISNVNNLIYDTNEMIELNNIYFEDFNKSCILIDELSIGISNILSDEIHHGTNCYTFYDLYINLFCFSKKELCILSRINYGLSKLKIHFTISEYTDFHNSSVNNLIEKAISVAILQHNKYKQTFLGALQEAEAQVKVNQLHPMWPAYARYSAGLAEPGDAEYLNDLAAHPEKCGDEKLAMALQFFVRGDILMADGSILLLDDLFAEAGVEPLPLLDPAPLGLTVVGQQ